MTQHAVVSEDTDNGCTDNGCIDNGLFVMYDSLLITYFTHEVPIRLNLHLLGLKKFSVEKKMKIGVPTI